MINPKILLVITGWNCEKYVKRCIDSVKAQTYKNYVVAIVNDGSNDNTYNIIKDNINTKETLFINFNINMGAFNAREHAIMRSEDFDIIALLDMDDALLPNALALVAKKYENENILMTYGNWKNQHGKPCHIDIKYSDEIHVNRDYRKDVFRCTHLRTFKKELYFAIDKEKLINLEYYCDTDLFFTMQEMCGRERMAVIEEIIYIYNTVNPNSILKRFGRNLQGYAEIVAKEKADLWISKPIS